MKNNEYLSKEKMILAREHNEIQNTLLTLKNLINIREKEMEENIENIKRENDPDIINDELQRLKNLIKQRNSECDNLNNNLNILMEEKKILINKVNDLQLQLDSNKRYGFADSYVGGVDLNEKYIDKKSVNKYVENMIKLNKEYLKKKKYYKDQCKLFNQVIDVIMKMINKEQIKQIEKYDAYQKLMNNNLKYNNNMNDNNVYIGKEIFNSNEGIKVSNDNLNNINNSSSKKGNNNFVYNYNNNIFGENNSNLFNNKNDSGTYNNSNKNIINNNSSVNNNKVFNNNNNNNNVFNNNNNNFLDNKFNNNVFGNNNINTDNSKKGNNNNNNDNDEIEENISYSESLAQN